ncbi:MAG: diguanylate cyclase [Vicinamibacteria bacterium]|nr:diguanylate cyclase [Vicinamibacteria bacterium]
MRLPGSPFPFLSRLAVKILVVGSLCSVLPVLALGVHLLEKQEDLLALRVREALKINLLSKGNEIDNWTSIRLREALPWSASFVVFEGVETIMRGQGDLERARRDMREYLDSVLELGHYRVYESLFVVDLAGNVLSGTRTESLERWGRDLLAGGAPPKKGIMSPIFRSENLGHPTLLVLQPIQGRRGATVGYLVERIDVRELESLLKKTEEGLHPEYWLLDEKGNILVRAGEIAKRPGQQRLGIDPPDISALSAPVNEVQLPDVGRVVLGFRRLSAPARGFLVAMVTEEEAYRSFRESRRALLRLGIPFAAVVLFILIVMTIGVLRPILILSEGARRISAGDLSVFLPVRGRDEIAQLTMAFNEMTRRLRVGRDHLEQTRDELARANDDLRAANQALETLAITDGLTGLYNHRHFQDMIEREMRRSQREGRPLSLLLLDLDHFKMYNDRYGHVEGDAALRRVAGQILKTIRTTDTAFRYGGEELAVLLPGCTKDQAFDVADKIREAVETATARMDRGGGRVTVSIGVAATPDDGRVARGLMDAADAALYKAKEDGRNRVIAAGRRIEEARKSIESM